jgi:trk system potassium uptake protein TrkA
VVHGSENTSKIVNRRIGQIEWPPSTVVGAIVRESGEVVMAHHEVVIEALDHLVFFVSDRNQIPELESLIRPTAQNT